MKTPYLQPEFQIMEFHGFQVICGSPTDGVDGGFNDLIVDDDSGYFVD